MMKKLGKYFFPVLVISFFVYIMIGLYNRNKYDNEIMKTGKYCLAVVRNKTITKGNTSSIDYKYLFGGKEYSSGGYVSESFYEHYQVKDTIVIRVLLSDPRQSLIIEDIKYDKSFGKQPSTGWDKISNK